MKNKNLKISSILNIILFILELIGVVWMFSGIHLFGEESILVSSKLEIFKYFTVDSNILMGLISLIVGINEIKSYKNNKKLSKINYILKLIGTTCVTLTMLVSIFFLVPTIGFHVLYDDSCILFHVINPILSIIIFTIYERNNTIDYKNTFYSIIPVLLYSIYYIAKSLPHLENNKVSEQYDWYGFYINGLSSIFIVLPIILLVTYIISYFLWKINNKTK